MRKALLAMLWVFTSLVIVVFAVGLGQDLGPKWAFPGFGVRFTHAVVGLAGMAVCTATFWVCAWIVSSAIRMVNSACKR